MFSQARLKSLIYWISERESIREKKALGYPKPWSENKVMQETYFCNVHREDDRVTKFIRETYSNYSKANPYEDLDCPELNMMVARMVNKPASLAVMEWPFPRWSFQARYMFLKTMKVKGTWGSAYIVSTNGRAMPKHEYVRDLLSAALTPLLQVRQATTLAGAHDVLTGIQGLGSFMSGQLIADLKNTEGYHLMGAPDWWTWCAPGPGSLRGMGWLTETRVTPTMFNHSMPPLMKEMEYYFSGMHPKMCMQDLQNCLCEFDKFMRVTNGTGRSKRKYNGG